MQKSFSDLRSRRAFVQLLGLLCASPVLAATPGHGGEPYAFSTHKLVSADGKRFYRLTIATPRQPAPPKGYPVVYLLDGNAVIDALRNQDLDGLRKRGLPVLAAIGDDPDMPENLAARPYDYLPPAETNGPTYETDDRSTLAGGADIFLDLLLQRVRPLVRSAAPIDAGRQTLFGHSYGGLFALHALFTRPAEFQSYVAVSPSIRWHDGFALKEEAAYVASPREPRRLFLMVGGDEQRAQVVNPPVPGGPAQGTVHTSRQSAMAERLGRLPWMTVRFREFAHTQHGPMLPASLQPGLEWAVADGAS